MGRMPSIGDSHSGSGSEEGEGREEGKGELGLGHQSTSFVPLKALVHSMRSPISLMSMCC